MCVNGCLKLSMCGQVDVWMCGCCNCLLIVFTLILRPEDHGIWSMIESEVQLRPLLEWARDENWKTWESW